MRLPNEVLQRTGSIKENRNYAPEYEQKEIEDKLSWFRDFSMMTDEESEDPLEYMNVLQKDIF